jgi:hypothetical protein
VNAARRQIGEWAEPFGYALTFFALTIQVLLPLLVGLEITFADRLGIDATTICSAVIDGTLHGDNSHRPAHHDLQDGCPLCTALAAAQGFTAPVMGTIAPVAITIRIAFETAVAACSATCRVAAYNSRAPPALA